MKRKSTWRALPLLLIFLSSMPAYAAGDVIIDRLTKSQAEELDIVIPNKTPPGFHSIMIEVYDDNGVVKDKEIPFCKNLRGEINWDNKCPDVTQLASLEALLKIRVREDLPPYHPAQEPEKSSGLQVTALAFLAAFVGFKRSTKKNTTKDGGTQSSREPRQEKLTSIKAGRLHNIDREIGWGDTSKTWKSHLTPFVDKFFVSGIPFLQRFSPLVARTTVDGSYLRAIFGGYSLILYPLALLFGLKALIDTRGQALAPLLITVVLIIYVATFDALAGAVTAIIFLFGTLLTGGVADRSQILTILGVMGIFVAPALLASTVRPLRRTIADSDDLWERLTDYALTILLTGWLVEKMVLALNGLSGLQMAVTYQARTIAVFASIAVLLRLLGEDVATYLYPKRLRTFSVELAEPTKLQKIVSSWVKLFFFIVLATPYVGVNVQLLLALVIFIIPLVANLTFVTSLPKFSSLAQLLPKATPRLIVLTIIGSILAAFMQERFADPTAYLRWCFVMVAIPSFLISVLEWFSGDSNISWKYTKHGRWIYRIIGVFVFLLTVLIVQGFDFARVFAT